MRRESVAAGPSSSSLLYVSWCYGVRRLARTNAVKTPRGSAVHVWFVPPVNKLLYNVYCSAFWTGRYMATCSLQTHSGQPLLHAAGRRLHGAAVASPGDVMMPALGRTRIARCSVQIPKRVEYQGWCGQNSAWSSGARRVRPRPCTGIIHDELCTYAIRMAKRHVHNFSSVLDGGGLWRAQNNRRGWDCWWARTRNGHRSNRAFQE